MVRSYIIHSYIIHVCQLTFINSSHLQIFLPTRSCPGAVNRRRGDNCPILHLNFLYRMIFSACAVHMCQLLVYSERKKLPAAVQMIHLEVGLWFETIALVYLERKGKRPAVVNLISWQIYMPWLLVVALEHIT